jgi:hypothetical protein
MRFKLGFKAFKEGKGIRGSTCKTGENLIFVEAAHFARIAFHYGVAEGNLAVAADNHLVVATNTKNRSHKKSLQIS